MLDMFDSEQVNANSVSTYHNYPLQKPFLNTDWNRNTQQPLSKAFPESNREGIINFSFLLNYIYYFQFQSIYIYIFYF